MDRKERYINLSDRQVKDTQNQSQDFLSIKTICRLLNNQDSKIADLEAKLAESEKLNKRLQQIVDKLIDKEFAGETLVNAVNAVYEPLYQNKYDEAEQLKQQLAESEEIHKLLETQLKDMERSKLAWENEYFKLEKQLAEKEKENSVLKAVIDKNKTGQFGAVNICNAISEFYEPLVKDMIIAELEKVKEYNKGLVYSSSLIDNFIEQQIKSLKGEK